jgi:hypothetical protein
VTDSDIKYQHVENTWRIVEDPPIIRKKVKSYLIESWSDLSPYEIDIVLLIYCLERIDWSSEECPSVESIEPPWEQFINVSDYRANDKFINLLSYFDENDVPMLYDPAHMALPDLTRLAIWIVRSYKDPSVSADQRIRWKGQPCYEYASHPVVQLKKLPCASYMESKDMKEM